MGDLITGKFDTIRAAVELRDKFLELHPQFQAFQYEIDTQLHTTNNALKRMIILRNMMVQKLTELEMACENAKKSMEGGDGK